MVLQAAPATSRLRTACLAQPRFTCLGPLDVQLEQIRCDSVSRTLPARDETSQFDLGLPFLHAEPNGGLNALAYRSRAIVEDPNGGIVRCDFGQAVSRWSDEQPAGSHRP